MQSKEIDRIIRKYKAVFEILEEYDRTRELPLGRQRIGLSLSRRTLRRLRQEREKTGKPTSRIVEEALEQAL